MLTYCQLVMPFLGICLTSVFLPYLKKLQNHNKMLLLRRVKPLAEAMLMDALQEYHRHHHPHQLLLWLCAGTVPSAFTWISQQPL